LPQSAASLIACIFDAGWETMPVTLSNRWSALVMDMGSRHEFICSFVRSELGITQGRDARGINFIDPLPIIEVATEFQKQPTIQSLKSDYFDSFWKTRYIDGLSGGLQPYTALADVLAGERTEVGKLVESAQQILTTAGFDTTDLKAAFVAFCQDIELLVEARKTSNFTLPNTEFDNLFKLGVFTEHRQRWGFALEKASRVTTSSDHYDILLFDPQQLTTAVNALNVVDSYTKLLDRELSLQEEAVKEGGDPKEIERRLLDSLGTIANLAEQEQETDDANS